MLNALQICAALVTLVLIGFAWKVLGVVGSGKASLASYNRYLFYVGIPAAVFKALAVQRFNATVWPVILVFLCLRAALLLAFALVEVPLGLGPGGIASDYMNATWINTVIFGIPIFSALYGPASAVYPVLASVSSFFFQQPVQLVLFELSETRELPAATGALDKDFESSAAVVGQGRRSWRWRAMARKLAIALLLNPIMWATVGGVAWSATEWQLGLFLDQVVTLAAGAVTPLACFSIGVFMHRRPPRSLAFWLRTAAFLLVKFFAMPLLCIPFVLAFSVQGTVRQMCILMAALPVALSSFIMAARYDRDKELAAVIIVLSTLLVLPTQIMWLAIADAMFPQPLRNITCGNTTC